MGRGVTGMKLMNEFCTTYYTWWSIRNHKSNQSDRILDSKENIDSLFHRIILRVS